MGRFRSVLLVGGLCGCYALLLIGSVAGNLRSVVAACLASFVVEGVLARRPYGRVRLLLRLIDADQGWRYFGRLTLILVFLLRSGRLSATQETFVIVAVLARHLVLSAFLAMRLVIRRRRMRRVETRNLGVPGGELPTSQARPWLVRNGPGLVLSTDVLITVALAWASIRGSYAAVAPAAVCAVVLAVAVALPLLPHAWTLFRLPDGSRLVDAAEDAVRRHAPVVILYFSGGLKAVYQVNMWLETMERLDQPVLVLLRERRYLNQLAPTTVPVVCLPYASDLMNFEIPSARVSLYVSNVGKNIHLLRLPTLLSAFIGHGDSDKTASFNPYTKVYDEIWVAGEAGRQRYLRARVGVREDQIRLVGRPQLDVVRAAAPRTADAPFTVLYAPTWEGWINDPHSSSLIPMGLEIVRSLLASPGVRVMFKPHPLTGTVKAEARQVSQAIAGLLAAADSDHVVVASQYPLYECFNQSDALISDISSVVSDYLQAGKPYFVTNGADVADVMFREENPSARGAYLIGPGASELIEGLADARARDSMRARRREARIFLLGDPAVDSMTLFRRAVADLVARSEALRGVEALRPEDDDERLEQRSETTVDSPAV